MDEGIKIRNEHAPSVLDGLIESTISTVHKGSGKLFESEKYPNKIIRIESVNEMLYRHGNKMEALELVEHAKVLYKELQLKYGIEAPAEFFCEQDIDGKQVVYSVVDKIEGKHLEDVEVTSESLEKVKDLYSSVAKYFLDKYKEGGLYLWDLNNQSQYIYGSKNNDELEKVYLIDTDIWLNNSMVGMFLVIEWLTRHMSEVEEHFSTKFKEARNYINQFITQSLPEDTTPEQLEKINSNIMGIKRFLNGEELGDGPETGIPVFE